MDGCENGMREGGRLFTRKKNEQRQGREGRRNVSGKRGEDKAELMSF